MTRPPGRPPRPRPTLPRPDLPVDPTRRSPSSTAPTGTARAARVAAAARPARRGGRGAGRLRGDAPQLALDPQTGALSATSRPPSSTPAARCNATRSSSTGNGRDTGAADAPGRERDSAETQVLHAAERDAMIEPSRTAARQREVLVLRYYADLSEAQIADALEIAPGSVKAHAHRGLMPCSSPRSRSRSSHEPRRQPDPDEAAAGIAAPARGRGRPAPALAADAGPSSPATASARSSRRRTRRAPVGSPPVARAGGCRGRGAAVAGTVWAVNRCPGRPVGAPTPATARRARRTSAAPPPTPDDHRRADRPRRTPPVPTADRPPTSAPRSHRAAADQQVHRRDGSRSTPDRATGGRRASSASSCRTRAGRSTQAMP